MTLSTRWCRCSHDAFRLRCPNCCRLSLRRNSQTSSTNSRSVIRLRSSSLTSLAMHMIRKSLRCKCGLSGTLRSLSPTLYSRCCSCCGIKTAISGSHSLAISLSKLSSTSRVVWRLTKRKEFPTKMLPMSTMREVWQSFTSIASLMSQDTWCALRTCVRLKPRTTLWLWMWTRRSLRWVSMAQWTKLRVWSKNRYTGKRSAKLSNRLCSCDDDNFCW